MKKILFLLALLLAVLAQAQESAKAQQVNNIVNPQDTVLKKKEVVKVIVKRDRSKDDEKNAAMKAFVGQRFKDVEMLDTDGNLHKLSEYVGNGHWLFVDMWASWCGPCRAEMPHVVAAYEKYHAEGLEMVSISLDNQKENWVKAITALNMPWTHLSDLKGWQSVVCGVYKVWAIPDNLLINPQGEIVARNLRGEALHEKLKEVFEGK